MVCSLAKFLALGLIASEGHGPVFAEATPSLVTETEWKNVMGLSAGPAAFKTGKTWHIAKAQPDLCSKMNENYKILKSKDLDENTWPSSQRTAKSCDNAAYGKIRKAMLAAWKEDAKARGFNISWGGVTVEHSSAASNAKAKLITKLNEKLKELGGTDSTTAGKDDYYTRITDIKTKILSMTNRINRDWELCREAAAQTIQIADEMMKTADSDSTLRNEAMYVRTKAVNLLKNNKPQTLALAAQQLEEAEGMRDGAEAWRRQKQDDDAAAVGGVFAVILGLVGLTFAFIMSPCMQCNLETGQTYKNWATGEVNPEWTQMESYKKAYGDKTPEDYRNEVRRDLGLPVEGKVDSAKTSAGALSFVPVAGLMAGAGFVVARRGLNKRRAQKKAKRASRAQEKLHEDL